MRRRDLLRGALAWSLAGCAPPPRAAPVVHPGAAPASSRPRSPEVIIVGGGLAGLAAALELTSRGMATMVLEAQARPGGRILTIRSPLPDGLYAEAGAKHVVGDPDLLALLKALGVEVVPRPRRSGPPLAQITYLGGVRRIFPAGEEPPDEHPLTPEESALGFRARLTRYLPALAGFDPLRDRHADAEARELDAVRADHFLEREGASPGLIAALEGSFGVGDGFATMSALSLVRDVANFQRETELGAGGRIALGSDRLPEALASALGDALVLGARVTRIEQRTTGVRVDYVQDGAGLTVTGDRILIAVPSTVVAAIDTRDALSSGKRRMLAAIEATSVTRIWAATSRRPWLARGESATADTDLPIGRLQDELEGREGREGLLSVYQTGAAARRLAALGDLPRISEALQDMDRVYPGTRDAFTVGASKAWDEDPFARGGYAFFRPGQLTEDGGSRWANEGRIHFAGCHTSHRPGFMHGALSSARRAVREIVAARAMPRSE